MRTVIRGIACFAANARMLNPARYGLFAWQLVSHKLCRWLVPAALIVAWLSNAALVFHSDLYLVTMAAQFARFNEREAELNIGMRSQRSRCLSNRSCGRPAVSRPKTR